MTLRDINQHIEEAGTNNANAYLDAYLSFEEEIVDYINSDEGLKTELYIHHDKGELELVKFVSIFSDFFSLYMSNSTRNEYHITYQNPESKFFVERQVTFPNSVAEKTKIITENISVGHIHHSSQDVKKTLDEYRPLFESSKSVLRPVRAVLVRQDPPIDKIDHVVYYADSNTDTRHWTVKDDFSRDSLPIENFLKPGQSKTLLDVTLPYFRTIDLATMSKILDDESDLLSILRRDLKKLITEYSGNDKNLEEIHQDVLRPEIDTINRKFKNIQRMRLFGRGQSLGLFSLALVKVFVDKQFTFDFITSLLTGTGTTKFIASQMEYQKSLNELRDKPYFLLWRLQRRPRL